MLADGRAAGADGCVTLVTVALDAMTDRPRPAGPVPPGGPAAAAAMAPGSTWSARAGVGEKAALDELSRVLTAGSVDPADPWCAAHLHGPTLAVAAAADLVGSMLNPSMDSWDQAPVASELERALTAALARLCFPATPRRTR